MAMPLTTENTEVCKGNAVLKTGNFFLQLEQALRIDEPVSSHILKSLKPD